MTNKPTNNRPEKIEEFKDYTEAFAHCVNMGFALFVLGLGLIVIVMLFHEG